MRGIYSLAFLAVLVSSGLAEARNGSQPAFRPHVFNLVNEAGRFETSSAGQRQGWRSVGFWSYRTPRVGDLIVKRANTGRGLSAWEIESVQRDFTGSNGESFWKGIMRDLVETQTFTQTHVDAIHDAARTQPELLP
ncbi:MAG: hypothetical protein IT371_16595 [Deltaproteobacteria bacterium]|nr:hypothetical protein [Deltaproteobacteria bacterium]